MSSYYHVSVSTSPDEASELLFSDLDENKLKSQFVKPYKRGSSKIIDGIMFDFSKIKSTHIIKTSDLKSVCLQRLQDESLRKIRDFNNNNEHMTLISLPYGSSDIDISEAGEDVTSNYIVHPPGRGDVFSNIKAFASNGWVVGIGTGVIVALIAALMA